jgi:hypothetical protein
MSRHLAVGSNLKNPPPAPHIFPIAPSPRRMLGTHRHILRAPKVKLPLFAPPQRRKKEAQQAELRICCTHTISDCIQPCHSHCPLLVAAGEAAARKVCVFSVHTQRGEEAAFTSRPLSPRRDDTPPCRGQARNPPRVCSSLTHSQLRRTRSSPLGEGRKASAAEVA